MSLSLSLSKQKLAEKCYVLLQEIFLSQTRNESCKSAASSKHNNTLCQDNSPLLVFNLMERATRSRPKYTSIIPPIGQCDCGRS